ncbi:hypothetical protein FRC02_007543 [Tulasnella sp. 418]|nr:hypothetical protein FRC02_007543 [Tulasnella sp. 418]
MRPIVLVVLFALPAAGFPMTTEEGFAPPPIPEEKREIPSVGNGIIYAASWTGSMAETLYNKAHDYIELLHEYQGLKEEQAWIPENSGSNVMETLFLAIQLLSTNVTQRRTALEGLWADTTKIQDQDDETKLKDRDTSSPSENKYIAQVAISRSSFTSHHRVRQVYLHC